MGRINLSRVLRLEWTGSFISRPVSFFSERTSGGGAFVRLSEKGRWTAFGVAVCILGITILIAGYTFSQQRETKIVDRCLVSYGSGCASMSHDKLTVVTPLAIVGYFLAAFGMLFIFSGCVIFFILTSRSRSGAAKANTFTESASPEVGEPER